MNKERAEIFDQIDATNEAVTRLALIIANALPHIAPEITGLITEFSRVINEIKTEYNPENIREIQ